MNIKNAVVDFSGDESGKKVLKAFKDNYFRKLSIFDHIRELNNLYDKYKDTGDDLKLRKELIDLKILIDMELAFDNRKHKSYDDLYNERMSKFCYKIEFQDNNKKWYILKDENGDIYVDDFAIVEDEILEVFNSRQEAFDNIENFRILNKRG